MKKPDIVFTHPSGRKAKDAIRRFMDFLNKYWLSSFLWVLFLTLSFTAFSFTALTTKSAAFERFYTQVTETIQSSAYKKQNLLIQSLDNSAESYNTFREFHNQYNPSNEMLSPYKCNLAVSSRVNPGAFMVQDESSVRPISISLLSPKTLRVIEKPGGDGYRIDSIDIDMLYPTNYPTTQNEQWCYVSTYYADRMMEELDLQDRSAVIGHTINVTYNINGVPQTGSPSSGGDPQGSNDMRWTIVNIYDATKGIAPYYQSVYNDFIISYHLNYRNIDRAGMSVDLLGTLTQTQSTFNLLFTTFAFEQFSFTFVQDTSKTGVLDLTLNEWQEIYLTFNEQAKQYERVIWLLVAMIFFFASFILLSKIVIPIIHTKNVRYSHVIAMMFVFSYLILSIVYLILKFVVGMPILVSSDIVAAWVVMIILELCCLVILPILERKIGGDSHETTEIDVE